MSGKRPPSSLFKREWVELYVPSVQTKELMVPLVGNACLVDVLHGNNYYMW